MSVVQGKMDRLCAFIVRHRIIVFLVVLLGAAVFASGAARIKSEVILWELFPYDHPYLKLHAKFAQIFGTGASNAVIAVQVKKGDIYNKETLTKISEMTREIELWDEVYRILTTSMASLSVKVSKALAMGEISLAPLMFPAVPETEEEIAILKRNVFSSPGLHGTLVSENASAALIITMFKENISYEKAFEVLRDLQARYEDENTSIHIIGFPMLMGWIYSYKSQMYVVFALSVAFMLLILFAIYINRHKTNFKTLNILLFLMAIGSMGVGIFTEDFNFVHGAIASVAFFFAGLSRVWSAKIFQKPFSTLSILLGLMALIALTLYSLGMVTSGSITSIEPINSVFYLGLGPGGMERIIVYPALMWLAGFGGYMLKIKSID